MQVIKLNDAHLGILQGPEKHLKEPQAVSPMARHNLIGVDNIAAALAHLVGSG